jgi:hypothetical protein
MLFHLGFSEEGNVYTHVLPFPVDSRLYFIVADIQERMDCDSNEQQKLDHLVWAVRKHIEKFVVSNQNKMLSCKCTIQGINFNLKEGWKCQS